jgi:hypothetical protein
MSDWKSTQSVVDLGYRDAGGGRWVRDEPPCTVLASKPAFVVQSDVRPDSSAVWNRVYVTVTNPLSGDSSLWWAFDLSGQQTDRGGSGELIGTYLAGYADDDVEALNNAEASTFSELREYAAQVATNVLGSV